MNRSQLGNTPIPPIQGDVAKYRGPLKQIIEFIERERAGTNWNGLNPNWEEQIPHYAGNVMKKLQQNQDLKKKVVNLIGEMDKYVAGQKRKEVQSLAGEELTKLIQQLGTKVKVLNKQIEEGIQNYNFIISIHKGCFNSNIQDQSQDKRRSGIMRHCYLQLKNQSVNNIRDSLSNNSEKQYFNERNSLKTYFFCLDRILKKNNVEIQEHILASPQSLRGDMNSCLKRCKELLEIEKRVQAARNTQNQQQIPVSPVSGQLISEDERSKCMNMLREYLERQKISISVNYSESLPQILRAVLEESKRTQPPIQEQQYPRDPLNKFIITRNGPQPSKVCQSCTANEKKINDITKLKERLQLQMKDQKDKIRSIQETKRRELAQKETQIRELNTKTINLQNEINRIVGKGGNFDGEKQDYVRKEKESQVQIQRLKNQNVILKSESDQNRGKINQLESEKIQLLNELNKIRQEIGQINKNRIRLVSENQQYALQLQRLRDQITNTQCAQQTQNVYQERGRNQEQSRFQLQGELKQMNQRIYVYEQEKRVLSDQMMKLNNQVKMNEQQIMRLVEMDKQNKLRIEVVYTQIQSKTTQIEDLNRQNTELLNLKGELEMRLQESEKQVLRLKEQERKLWKANTKIEDLDQQVKDLKKEQLNIKRDGERALDQANVKHKSEIKEMQIRINKLDIQLTERNKECDKLKLIQIQHKKNVEQMRQVVTTMVEGKEKWFETINKFVSKVYPTIDNQLCKMIEQNERLIADAEEKKRKMQARMNQTRIQHEQLVHEYEGKIRKMRCSKFINGDYFQEMEQDLMKRTFVIVELEKYFERRVRKTRLRLYCGQSDSDWLSSLEKMQNILVLARAGSSKLGMYYDGKYEKEQMNKKAMFFNLDPCNAFLKRNPDQAIITYNTNIFSCEKSELRVVFQSQEPKIVSSLGVNQERRFNFKDYSLKQIWKEPQRESKQKVYYEFHELYFQ